MRTNSNFRDFYSQRFAFDSTYITIPGTINGVDQSVWSGLRRNKKPDPEKEPRPEQKTAQKPDSGIINIFWITFFPEIFLPLVLYTNDCPYVCQSKHFGLLSRNKALHRKSIELQFLFPILIFILIHWLFVIHITHQASKKRYLTHRPESAGWTNDGEGGRESGHPHPDQTGRIRLVGGDWPAVWCGISGSLMKLLTRGHCDGQMDSDSTGPNFYTIHVWELLIRYKSTNGPTPLNRIADIVKAGPQTLYRDQWFVWKFWNRNGDILLIFWLDADTSWFKYVNINVQIRRAFVFSRFARH